ncbi:GNAT family N-acetyltransferase [Sandaracinobacteroides hominis]|uniref:GNAT family N-acetyltransferase n=1 Tax=Sandaracinobacteroides hominis TaxID=2780086 RepID=UPI0018F3CE60|nr:GNAT family N-acetyltransferase [Sandaracinobacteroides hominis]
MGGSFTSDSVRAASRADAAACAEIYRPHVEHGTATFETEAPDVGEMEARIGRCLERGWPWLVAERDGEMIGYAYCTQFRDRAAYRHTAENSVYVRSELAGQGVGRLLMQALLPEARASGFQQLIAVIGDSGNAGSIGLHRAFGFRDAGVMTEVGCKFGRWIDVVFMQLELRR